MGGIIPIFYWNKHKTKNYLLYCAGGGRSGECLDLMQKNNFKSVAHLQNGFDEWVKKGFEVEKKK